jgi:DNA-binding beta-propeller fold protein YncE
LASERAIDRESDWGEPGPPSANILDRRLSLSLSVSRWLAVAVALVSGFLLRFPGLDRWALSAIEGETALAARDLILGNTIPADLLERPFTVLWAALFMFVGAPSDPVARMAMAVAGLLVIVLVLLLGRWIGSAPAASAAILIALSPTMIANSRRLDGGMLIAMLVLTIIACALAARERPSLVWPGLFGAAATALFLTGPLGIAALILAVAAVILFARSPSIPKASALVAGAVGGVTTFILFTTVFFTRLSGLYSAPAEIMRQLYNEHLAHAGDRFHVPVMNLVINEQLLIVLAIVALVASEQRALTRPLGIWTGITIVVVSLLGDPGIAGHALVVLPLALLAGIGATHVIMLLPWTLIRRGPASIYIAVLILLFLAVLSLIGLLTPSTGLTGWDWLVRFLLVVVVVVLPLVITVSMLSPRIRGHHGILTLGAILLVLSTLTIRSAVLSATERPGEPMEPLAQGMLAESMPAVISRIERVSIDLTRTQRTTQDPTGGHGLVIAIDEESEHPLRWYFRDFPNVTVFDPAADVIDGAVQVAFLAEQEDAAALAPGMVAEQYLYRHETPGIYSNPDWGSLARGVFDIREWRNFWGFLIQRTAPDPEYAIDFQLLVSPAIGERLFGPSGPFALDDLAGAGTQGGQFNSPRGIAIAEDGTTYVVDSGNQRIQVFDADGEFLQAFGEPGDGPSQLGIFGAGQSGAGGIAIAEGRLYVADTWNHRIQVFDMDGEYITSWGSFFDAQDDPELTAINPGQFYGPRGVTVLNERVYVTDTGNERIQVFDLDGGFIQMWGSTGTEPGDFLEPVGITAHEDTILIADSHNARIARYTADGELLDPWTVTAWDGLRFFEPYLAVSPDGRVFATTSVTNEVLVFSDDGQGGSPLPAGDVLRPFGIAIQPDGDEALITDGIRNGVVTIDIAAR